MWLLECEAVFGDKRKWLRPGTRGVWGRVKGPPPGQYTIGDGTVSRQHLVIEVSDVRPGDCTKADGRSELIIQDLQTKIGTLLDGVSIKGQRKVLKGDKHEIKLGRCEDLLKIVWVPVVFTLALQNRELLAGAANPFQDRLEPLDIKCLTHYSRENTTHVLTQKRNTSKTLQALVNGKHIVLQDSFLDAVFTATARGSNDEKSRLEEDFDNYWPNALDYLPPPGKEPTQLPASAYSPDPSRQTIFEGYSFVFYDEGQFNNLIDPITNGGGKAFLRPAEPNVTTVADFVLYVKGIAGEKGLGEFEDGSEGKGVVVVRFQPKGAQSEWYTKFITETSQLLDHRPIEQSEFLDAILRNDASVLRRPLEPAQSGVVASSSFAANHLQQSTAPIATQQNTAVSTPLVPPTTTRKPRKPIVSRFKGFDDSSDEEETVPAQTADTPAAINAASQESGMFVSQREETPFVSQANPSQSQYQFPHTSSRKRSAPPVDEVSVMDQLAPAAVGLKRRRIADEAARRERGEPSPPPPAVERRSKPETIKLKSKKPEKEIDVLEIARLRREKEAEVAAADRAALEASLEGVDINEIRNIAIVEEMAVGRPRSTVAPAEHADNHERWQEHWNGRKNFKQFRRCDGANVVPRHQKVIVGLVQASKTDHGSRNSYWLDSDDEDERSNKGKKSQSRSRTVSVRRGNKDSDDDTDMSDSPPPIFTTTQRGSTARSQGSQTLADKTNVSRNSTSQAQNKRPAAAPLKNPAPAKKAKKLVPQNNEDSDDSDDGTKFKFRRR